MSFSMAPVSKKLKNKLLLRAHKWDYLTEITDPERLYLYRGKRNEDLERITLCHLPANIYTIINNMRLAPLREPNFTWTRPQGQFPAMGVFLTKGLEISRYIEELNSLEEVYPMYRKEADKKSHDITTKADSRLLEMAEATGSLQIDKLRKRVDLWLHVETVSRFNANATDLGIPKSEFAAYCIALAVSAHGPSPHLGEGDRQKLAELFAEIHEVLELNTAALQGAVYRRLGLRFSPEVSLEEAPQ